MEAVEYWRPWIIAMAVLALIMAVGWTGEVIYKAFNKDKDLMNHTASATREELERTPDKIGDFATIWYKKPRTKLEQMTQNIAYAYRRTRSYGAHHLTDEEILKVAEQQAMQLIVRGEEWHGPKL